MSLFRNWLEKMTPPTSKKFFLMLKDQAAAAHEVARVLKEGVTSGQLGTPEFTAQIHMHERKVDQMMDKLMHTVRQTMIHPVDPDDLRNMAYTLDSTVDTIDHFVWRMEAYRLKASPAIEQMIEALHEMTGELDALFDALIAGNHDEVLTKYKRLAALEHGVDQMYHAAITRLHANGERALTVEHEVVHILERCADQCRHVARAVVVMLERNN